MRNRDFYNDPLLVQQLQQGDEAAMKQIFDSFYSRLLYYSTKLIRQEDEAADIVQEAFLNFWRNIQTKGTLPENIQAYLFRMVRNRCLNYLERQQMLIDKKEEVMEHYHTQWQRQMDELELKEDVYDQLTRALGHLTPIQMEVLQLLYKDGFSIAEVAEQLNTTANNVRVHKARAIDRLKSIAQTDLFTILTFLLIYFPGTVMK